MTTPQLPPRAHSLSQLFSLPNLVLAITILGGLVTFLAFTPSFPTQNKVIVTALTLVYLSVTFFASGWVEHHDTALARGESFLQPSIAAKVVAEFARMSAPPKKVELAEPLSERELEILKMVCAGASNKEIGTALFITEGTVKNHLSNILGKLGVRDRT
jgi:DNA-binding CsgD family transcriptional regulator